MKKKIQETANRVKIRLLTHRGKAIIINTIILANLWYTASIYIPSKRFFNRLNKIIYEIMWKKNEKINRKTMTLSPNEGGVGVINPLYKCQALWLKHIHSYIMHPTNNHNLTPYWCALQLRIFNRHLWNNSIPHCVDTQEVPPFYQNALKLTKSHYKELKDIPLENFTKKTYQLILYKKKIIPKIALTRPLPLVRSIWETMGTVDLTPNVRELWWQVSHDVIYTIHKLSAFKLTSDPRCRICKGPIENTIHCLFDCPTNKIALMHLKTLVPELEGKLYHQILDLKFDPPYQDRQAVVVGEYILAAWARRNLHLYEGIEKTPKSTAQAFLHRLRSRIKADHLRLENKKFNQYWRGNNFPVTVNDKGKLYIGF